MAPGNRKAPKRSTASESQYTLLEFVRDFPDDETCLQWLWRTRYSSDGENAVCESCEEVTPFRRYETKQQRQSWTCTKCGHHLHPTAGTIFHKSSTGLHLWFYAMYLMTSTRCGISAKQLERELGVTYKTAWRMFSLIRNELMTQEPIELSGEVEMDETYVGGKPRLSDKAQFGKTGTVKSDALKWSHEHKTGIFGMVERGGEVRAYVVPKNMQGPVLSYINAHVDPDATHYTDDARLYDPIAKAGRDRRVIPHVEKVYVSGNIHTQTIDGFWSLVKRGLDGTHHWVSPKWLQGYVNEYVFRYNLRDEDQRQGKSMFAWLLLRAAWSVRP